MLKELFNNENRKSGMIKYIFLIILLTILVLVFSGYAKTEKETEKVVEFKENTEFDYEVFLKENEFFEEKSLGKGNQYIASLIENINAEFTYELESDAENQDYKYDYKIVADVRVEDSKTHNTLYTSTEEIKNVEGKSFASNENLKINEKMTIDYVKYNQKITSFVNMYDLENVESFVDLGLYVYIRTSEQDDKEYLKNPVMTLKIPLTTNTIAIEIISNVQDQSKNTENGITKLLEERKFYVLTLILIVLNIFTVIKMVIFIFDTRNEESTYRMNLRKIKQGYGSYIQKIKKNFNFEGYQSIELETFENLIQVRDLVQAPILMLEREEETHFMVPTRNNIIYRYELNTGTKKKRIEAAKIKTEESV